MPIGQALSIQTNQVAATQPSARRAREHRSDNGATILPTSEYFVGLLRKVNRPDLVLQLLERASGTSFPELKTLADAAKGKLPVESRMSIFHAVAKLAASVRHTIERAAERIMLLEDEYGAQAVQSLLDDERADDAAVLAMPSDRSSRALHLCLMQEFPAQGTRRDERFDHAEHLQVMHRQWKSDHYSSHFLGPRGVVPKTGTDVEDVLRNRIAELFPKVSWHPCSWIARRSNASTLTRRG